MLVELHQKYDIAATNIKVNKKFKLFCFQHKKLPVQVAFLFYVLFNNAGFYNKKLQSENGL